ncbi:MAG: hypothetical protein RLZZ301_1091 [Bacteroidota bacterium]|jgi:hypothetical protein
MKQTLAFFFLWLVLLVQAQATLDWQWGPLQRSKGYLIHILPNNEGKLLSVHERSNMASSQFVLSEYEGFSELNSIKVKPTTPEGFGYYQQTLLIDGHPCVFIADRQGKEMKLFLRNFDQELNELESSELFSYTDTRTNSTPDFRLIQSPDRSHFAAFYSIPGRKSGTDIYGYAVYNSHFEKISSGEYSLPYEARLTYIADEFLNNNGAIFVGVIELEDVINQGIRTRQEFKNIHIYQIQSSGLRTYDFDLQGKRISNFELNANGSNKLTVFGMYSSSSWTGMQDGFFNAQIDLTKDQAQAVGFIPFTKEMVLSEYSANEQQRLERRMERNNDEAQLSRYEVRDLFTLADGSYVGAIEKYYVYTNYNYNAQTQQRISTTYYYYNDIIAFCIDSSGHLKWQQRIPKSQVSINDHGPFSSFACFLSGDHLFFIFNDSESNYGEDGQFNRKQGTVQAFSLSKFKNVGAVAQLDVTNGQQQRYILHQRQDQDILLVPKAFQQDRKNQGIYTYGIYGPQEKFGYLQFKTP